ncbi:hypothetical protein C8R45DRAFT_1096251 [Mycena sanguinolenta]|nr:hypothetical protein C8R45DRAFT_1096251 [Mycena sanguinolenta]
MSTTPSSVPASSESTTPSSTSSFAPLPTGCAGLSGLHADASFQGCVTEFPTVLQICCSAVGSTPVFANETCGCPYNAVFETIKRF